VNHNLLAVLCALIDLTERTCNRVFGWRSERYLNTTAPAKRLLRLADRRHHIQRQLQRRYTYSDPILSTAIPEGFHSITFAGIRAMDSAAAARKPLECSTFPVRRDHPVKSGMG
jgi:hypothetical protein